MAINIWKRKVENVRSVDLHSLCRKNQNICRTLYVLNFKNILESIQKANYEGDKYEINFKPWPRDIITNTNRIKAKNIVNFEK